MSRGSPGGADPCAPACGPSGSSPKSYSNCRHWVLDPLILTDTVRIGADVTTTLGERERVREPETGSEPTKKGAGAARVALGLALAGLSALLATWAFPPYGVWPLIFIAWVPMLVAQHRVLPRRW